MHAGLSAMARGAEEVLILVNTALCCCGYIFLHGACLRNTYNSYGAEEVRPPVSSFSNALSAPGGPVWRLSGGCAHRRRWSAAW